MVHVGGLDKLPFGVAVKLLDLVCAERALRPIFRFSIALLRLNEPQLLARDARYESPPTCTPPALPDDSPARSGAIRTVSSRRASRASAPQLPEGLLPSAWMAGVDLTMAINETPLDGELDGAWLARLFSV